MKLTIAAGILAARTFPVRSEESSEPMDILAGDRAVLKSEPFIITLTKHHLPQEQPTRTKARADEASFFHRPSSEAKPLVNRRSSPRSNGKAFCDPSSVDADIGMLSCGVGYECILDEVSSLGGVCAQATSRQLQVKNDACFLCPISLYVVQPNYDIVINDTESGYGGKSCKDVRDAAYNSLSINASSCSVVASASQTAGCCGPICGLCDLGSYAPTPGDYADSVVFDIVVDGISLPGYDVVTCKDLAYASRKGILDFESCSPSRAAAIKAGCCVPYSCFTCDVGSYIPSAESGINATCDDLRPPALSYFNNTLSEESCLEATQLAADIGCCIPRPIYDGCDVCGDASRKFFPDNFVFKVGTCEYAKSRLNDERCATYAPTMAPFCCGPAAPPPDGDTDAPGPTPDESPPSASLALWSTGTVVVSMMCLAISTLSASAWMLE